MKFYKDKFKEIRKLKKFKIVELAEKLEISRSTLWLWENGKVVPSEKRVKLLAKTLDVPIEMISDIKPEIEKSKSELGKYKEVILSWINTSNSDLFQREEKNEKYFEYFRKQLKEAGQAISLTRSLINFSDAMLYVKDVNQRYIAASNTFLQLIGLEDEKKIIGKNDYSIFPKHEAKSNLREDEKIMRTGRALRNRETLIPGSRKKKWGIISKIPTFDSTGKITGLIGSFIDITERRKNELLIEQFQKALGLMDEAIWVGQKAETQNNGCNAIKKFLYSVDDKLRKALLIENSNLSTEELWNYADSLIIEEDNTEKIKLEDLIKRSEAEIRLRLKLPNSSKIIYMKVRTYYDSDSKIFVWIATEDTETKRIELIREKLVRAGVEQKIIDEVTNDEY